MSQQVVNCPMIWQTISLEANTPTKCRNKVFYYPFYVYSLINASLFLNFMKRTNMLSAENELRRSKQPLWCYTRAKIIARQFWINTAVAVLHREALRRLASKNSPLNIHIRRNASLSIRCIPSLNVTTRWHLADNLTNNKLGSQHTYKMQKQSILLPILRLNLVKCKFILEF